MDANKHEIAIPLVELEMRHQATLTAGTAVVRPPPFHCVTVCCPCKLKSVNLALIVINLIILSVTMLVSFKTKTPFIKVLYNFGALYGADAQYRYHLHRLVLPIFLHVDEFHWLGNSWGMAIYGFDAEATLGHTGYILLYLVAGLAGNILQGLLTPYFIVVGASGAIMGVFGFIIVKTLSVAEYFSATYPIFLRLLLQATILSLLPTRNIATFCHLGGLLTGLSLGLLYYPSTSTSLLPAKPIIRGILGLTSLILGVAIVCFFFFPMPYQQFEIPKLQ